MSDEPDIAPDGAPEHGLTRRGMLTVSTAAVLTGLYGLYALTVNPLIDPPQVSAAGKVGRRGVAAPPPPPPPENVRMAGEYLASQPWAANAKYQLRTADAFIFADEWEPVDSDKAIRFRPFAMIWRQPGKEEDEPVTVVAESGLLQFAGEIDFANPDPGRIVGGALQGDVQITGPEGLMVAGRNFAFQEKALRIWSDNKVQFAYGPHRGTAHGVQIELIPTDAPGDDLSLAVDGVRSIRLRRNVAMDLAFNDEAARGKKDSKNAEDTETPVQVRIRSAGSFEFALETNIATFEENVRVYRPTGPSQDNPQKEEYDSLQCDVLSLLFDPETPEAAPANEAQPAAGEAAAALAAAGSTPPASDSADEAAGRLTRKLTFRRLRAQAAPGESVILISQANRLTARMTELIYDAHSRVAAMTAKPAVSVQQGASELQAPNIKLLHAEDGQLTSAICEGPGWLRFFDPETGKMQFAAQWAKQLRKYPEGNTGLDLIELEQQALVRQPDEQMGLAAEFIRLWVDQQRPGTKTESSSNGTADRARSARGDNVRLRKMLALKDVAMISPEMHGETKRLEVWFEDAPASTGALPEAAGLSRDRLQLASLRPTEKTSESVDEDPFSQSGRSRISDQPGSAADRPRSNTENPIEITSDLIRVRVLQGARREDTHAAEVWTEGNVKVTQARGQGEEPLELTGDRLYVENRAKDDQVMTVLGSPAHIRDRRVHIEGREVHMDRGNNLAWVTGAGLLQIPVDSTLEGEKLESPQLLDVWWKEQMKFDGESAQFFGDVRSVLGDSRMRCQEMQVKLSNRFSFSEPDRNAKAEIARVHCRDGVEFDSYEYEESKLLSIRRGRFAQFVLHRETGKTEADGPGWITVWRRGTGKRAGLAPTANVKANAPLKSDVADWEYMRIDFDGKTEGNVEQRFTTFNDRVRIVYGPVERPLATVDPDELPKDAGWMSCKSLRFTQHEAASDRDEYIELLASGNAELEGRTFNARADTISYDESKGLYMLRSLGTNKCTIWRQTQIGGEMSSVDAQRMEFIPARNVLKFDQATGFEGLQ